MVHSEIVYVVCETLSGNLRTTVGAFQIDKHGYRDCFIVGFNTDTTRPVARAGPDRIVRPHQSMTFNGSSSYDNQAIVSWTWRFDIDGETVEFHGAEPNFTFHLPGVYVVHLTVLDEVGHRGTDTVIVVVPDAGMDLVTTVGSRVRFCASGYSIPIATINWTWTFSYYGERIVLTGPEFNFTFKKTGVLQVALNVTDHLGNQVDDGLVITVLSDRGSLAEAGPDMSVDQHEPLHFESFDKMEGIMAWSWRILYNGSWEVVSGPDPNFTFQVVGTYEVTLWMRDDIGGPHTDLMRVTVNDVTPPVPVVGEEMVVDQFTTVVFDGTGSRDNVGIPQYMFSFVYEGDTVYMYDPIANFTFDRVGEYEIYLLVTDPAGNHAMGHLVLTVLDITPPDANAGSGQTVDQHVTVSFDGGGSYDNVGVSNWTWNFTYSGQGVTLYGAYPSFFFEHAGRYAVTLNVTDLAGFHDEDLITIVVVDITTPMAYAGEDIEARAGELVRFDGGTSTDNVGIVNYTWTFEYGGQLITLNGEGPSFVFNRSGRYLVTLDSLLVVVGEVEDPEGLGDHWPVAIAAVIVAIGLLLGIRSARASR